MTWLFLSIFLICHDLVLGGKSGPFQVSFIRVGDCKNPTQPLDPDPPSKFNAELYNTTTETNLMRGKTVVFRDFRNKQTKAKKYVWENNKWKVNYIINNNGCNRVFFPAIASALRLKYDLKTCLFYKGVYEFDNYNINKLAHTWMSTQDYGHVVWKVEHFTDAGSANCFEYEVMIEPLKKEKA